MKVSALFASNEQYNVNALFFSTFDFIQCKHIQPYVYICEQRRHALNNDGVKECAEC